MHIINSWTKKISEILDQTRSIEINISPVFLVTISFPIDIIGQTSFQKNIIGQTRPVYINFVGEFIHDFSIQKVT